MALISIETFRFLDQVGKFAARSLFFNDEEVKLLNQILRRTGGNQVHAARILGINQYLAKK
jgi:DNA-binding protein Fis